MRQVFINICFLQTKYILLLTKQTFGGVLRLLKYQKMLIDKFFSIV